jgi:LPS export ABC transporter protein LptC
MRQHGGILHIVLLSGCLLLLLVGPGCERRTPTPVSVDDLREEGLPQQESWNVHFLISNDGTPRVSTDAGYMARFEETPDSVYVLLEYAQGDPDSLTGQVTAHLFDVEGDSSGVLTADRLYYYEDDRRMEAVGNVVVVTEEGKRLESDRLLWFEAEREVRTAGYVEITTPSEQIRGFDLVADEDLETYQILRITGQVQMEDE